MRTFSDYEGCYIIAEIGVNHGGDMVLAKKMIDEAKKAGANAVKFQSFSADRLVTPGAEKAKYHKLNTPDGESHYEMIKKLELSSENHKVLFNYCNDQNIDFISTPYDIDSVDLLESLGVSQYKTASADIVDLFLHERLAKTRKPIIISVGMSTMSEIEDVLEIYRDFHSSISLLHCVSNYPCSHESLNLNVLRTLKNAFNHPVGFSDHSVDSHGAVVAVSLGAIIVEKHFTLDKMMDGPDHKASSTPDEFKKLVNDIRKTEVILGVGIKRCQSEEYNNSKISRKSLTINKDMTMGTEIRASDLVMKRPGSGIMAKDINRVIGLRIRKNVNKDYQPTWPDLF